MIGIALTVVAGFAAREIVKTLGKFWQLLFGTIRKIFEKLTRVVGVVAEGVKTFTVRLADGFKNIIKTYTKDKVTEEWTETMYRKSVDENDVPDKIKANIRGYNNEFDTTKLLELQMQH